MTWIEELEHDARSRLPVSLWAYLSARVAGARDEGWDAVSFRPRVLRDTEHVNTGVRVLGRELRTPLLAAPTALQVGVHGEGERATGRAVAGSGSLLGVSSLTGVPFAEVAATGAPWWFQVYLLRDRSATAALVRRAAEAGAEALVLTADTIALPADLDPGVGSPYANLTDAERDRAGRDGLTESFALGLETVAWLREISGGLPVLVKGVLRGDDAVRCLAAGAAGVVVSSHGGRRMGPTVPVAAALAEVSAAVSAAPTPGEVYVDSGLRNGRQVAVALALGAHAVFVGRPVLWGLAIDGEKGVAAVLDRLTAELADTMRRLGAASVAELQPDLVLSDNPTPGGTPC